MVRITIITPVFPYPKRGVYTGIERHVEGLCKGFKKLGHKVTVITTYWNGGSSYHNFNDMEIYRFKDLRVILGKLGKLSGVFELDFLTFSLIVTLNKKLLDTDLLLINLPFPFLSLINGNFTSIGLLHHAQPIVNLKDALSVPFGNIYGKLTRPDYWVAPSRFTAEQFIKLFKISKEKIRVIPEGVDLEKFNRSVDTSDINEKLGNERKILFVGNLHPNKGVHFLIKSFALVKSRINDVKLVIVGDGHLKHYLINLTKRLNLEKDVIFAGFVNDEDLPKYYASCDIFASASVLEGFGLIFLEAMALGKPIVAFNLASIPEVVENAGILVNEINHEKFANAIIELLSDEKLYQEKSENALKRAKLFSWEKIAEQFIKINEQS
jgi:glycosyltransferase involved in cell wall biosynthesis